jgi:alkanesulfonate monooxygenase SsuD/methylene tetrahydromethanopterin reductase-like flavin-dependent oxidoreductase (luciferase family)
VTKVRALLTGQPVQLHHAPAARPLRLGQPPAPDVPIWVAALGHHTTRVAAEFGDGWIPALVARDHLPAWAAQFNRLRETTTPHAQALTVAAGPITAAAESPDAARDIAAACIAWYLGAMGDIYPPVHVRPGLCHRGQRHPRREPAAQPATRHRPPPTPSSSLTSSPPTEPATRSGSNSALGPHSRHRHDPPAIRHVLAQHRSHTPGRSAEHRASDRP